MEPEADVPFRLAAASPPQLPNEQGVSIQKNNSSSDGP